MPRRLITVMWLLFAAVFVATPLAGADGGGANNVVLVQTSTNGETLARSAVQVTSAGSPTIASANIAEAVSSDCTGCSSSAVAVQTVFVTGDPNVVVPGNAAVATNAGCTSCTSFAYAYQYVLSTNGPVPISGDARAALNALRQAIADAAATSLPEDEKDAQLDGLAAEFKALIDAQVDQAGISARGVVFRQATSG